MDLTHGSISKHLKNWLDGCTQRVVVSSLVMSGGHQRLVLGLVMFNILVSNMESGIECTLSEFSKTTKLCGMISTLQRRGATQRDLGIQCDCGKPMKFNKDKFKTLQDKEEWLQTENW